MRVKLEWLRELVDLEGLKAEEIRRTLSLHSIEVEGIDKVVQGNNLVVGFVKECIAHPASNHLSVCQVDIATEVLQIVCGASNVRKGQYVIVAVNGAELPGGFKIKRTKIRGVESNGMICSLAEIGMENKYIPEIYEDGIYYFQDSVEVGSDALAALNLKDEVIELDITPDRGDLLSMIGVAIETGAVFNRPLKPLIYTLLRSKTKFTDHLEVINETSFCTGYYAQLVRNLKIKPSPWWLVSRLIAYGIRPINNVVDITNYILVLFGQPLHAFDYDKLGNKIVVRKAREKEKITTLDEIERSLEKDDIVITDGKKPVALAGVMGGIGTGISLETKNIVIEAAVFDPASIRVTSQRLDLRSDSSIRFERGVDINNTKKALDYTCYLLQELAEGEVIADVVYSGVNEIPDKKISINEAEVKKLLGVEIKNEEMKIIFERLGFRAVKRTDGLEVSVPNRRFDISITVDLIEEIARIYGFEKITGTLPKSDSLGGLSNLQKQRRKIRCFLNGLGLNEIYTYSLVSEKEIPEFSYFNEGKQEIEILKPLTQDHRYLRKSLLPGLIGNAKYCYSRKIKDLAIFEIGKIYYQDDEYQEEEMLSILLANQFTSTLWKEERENADFYLLKGVLETLFNKLGLEVDFQFLVKEIKELHPGISAEIIYNQEVIGYLGAIHPEYAKARALENIYIAEIRLKNLLEKTPIVTRFEEYSKVPSVERDIAIVISQDIPVGNVLAEIKNMKRSLLSNISLFDIYVGDKIAPEEKSIAIKLEFSSHENLNEETVNQKLDKILKNLSEKFNAKLRS
ncbi:MAG: phenylalanine--tRNA ligase subunit beta [Bacilli bacterium]|nr:phenylalanine--tRNA ligase subunit beta [Bacilli bacterium]